MKTLISLIFISVCFVSLTQDVEVLDRKGMKSLEPGTFEYVVMGHSTPLVIEEKSNVVIDFAAIDVPESMDSALVEVGDDVFYTGVSSDFTKRIGSLQNSKGHIIFEIGRAHV